ncbi:MAG: hypothetical protein AVDCRST_MAG02-158, partial [uncultured Rubrobacteraceae bacterium]
GPARLVRCAPHRPGLALELGVAGPAHPPAVLPAVARLRAPGGRPRAAPQRHLDPHALAAGLRAPVRVLGAGVVAVRGVQRAHPQLGVPRRRPVRRAHVLPADYPLVLHGDAGRLRDGRVRALRGLDAPPLRWAAPGAHAGPLARDARHRGRHGRALDGAARVLLSAPVGLGLLPRGADQRVARAAIVAVVPRTRGLAAGRCAGPRRLGVRLFLGDVELLVLPEVDLQHPWCRVPARLRDAAPGFPRLPALRPRTVRARAPHRAPAAASAPV